MQIAYPYIYNQLSEEPDFKQWNESIAAKLKLRKLTVEEQESLNAAKEFDDEWEKILYRMCQKETHLSNRVFQVSGLLNKIASIVNDDDQLGEIVESTMELSAVTNLKAFDSAPKKGRSNSVSYGIWRVVQTEDKKVEVYKNGERCNKAKPAFREIAAELGIEIKPEWTTYQFRSVIQKAMLNAGGK